MSCVRKGVTGLIALALGALLVSPAAAEPPAAPTSSAPDVPWVPPPDAVPPREPLPHVEIPPELLAQAHPTAGGVTMVDLPLVVTLALRNNPATRSAWLAARSAAAELGSKRSAYYPEVDASGDLQRVRQSAVGNRFNFQLTSYGPTIDISYLLFDFGGRKAQVAETRQKLFAADWEHNATIQDVVLQVEQAYYAYLGNKALREARKSDIEAAQQNLDAAQERHRSGVATIADVLQARTALAQARLDEQQVEGDLKATRGGLATAMGLPPDLPVDAELPEKVDVERVAAGVTSLLEQALAARPDLAAARARAAEARHKVERIAAERLPRITASGSVNRTYYRIPGASPSNNYAGGVSLNVPLFTGGRIRHDTEQARADAEAAEADAETLKQRVMLEVWTSYYALQTAALRVATTGDLVASAQQSADVAGGRYKAGVGSILDLLTAQRALADARAQRIQAQADWFQSLAQLARDLGVLGTSGAPSIAGLSSPHEESHENP